MTGSLPLLATGAVLLSAFAHASWNAIAHAIEDKLTGFVLLGLGAACCALVLLLVAPRRRRARAGRSSPARPPRTSPTSCC